jgi:hypothetical protein
MSRYPLAPAPETTDDEDRLWERVQAWLRDGKTGQIVLNVNRGSIESFHLNEYGRVRSGKGLPSKR